jgi:hypothetical protein
MTGTNCDLFTHNQSRSYLNYLVYCLCQWPSGLRRGSAADRLLGLRVRITPRGWMCRYSYSLRAGQSRNRIPVGARFYALVQTGPGAHSASYKMGTGSFPGVNRLGLGINNPPLSSAEVKERVVLYLYSLSGPS